MKILVFSDSHSSRMFMRRCMDHVKPQLVIHLGDHYGDGEVIGEEYSDTPLIQVPGNCDRYRVGFGMAEILVRRIRGVTLYLTHGHIHRVKQTLSFLLRDARAAGAQAVLYGHTHVADCHREEDGLWVLNPGSCGSSGGSAGLMEIENDQIISCRILRQADMEESV